MTFLDSAILVMMMPVLFGIGCILAVGAIACVGHVIQWWRDRTE